MKKLILLINIMLLLLCIGCDNKYLTNIKENKNSKANIIWQEKVFLEESGPCYTFSKIEIEDKQYMLIYNNYSPKHFNVLEVK